MKTNAIEHMASQCPKYRMLTIGRTKVKVGCNVEGEIQDPQLRAIYDLPFNKILLDQSELIDNEE